jgi:hypothetical protein
MQASQSVAISTKQEKVATGRSILRMLAGLASLALIPVVWIQGLQTIPTLREVIAAQTADMVGVWVFTWALVVVATIAAVGVAWAGWSWDREARRASTQKPS